MTLDTNSKAFTLKSKLPNPKIELEQSTSDICPATEWISGNRFTAKKIPLGDSKTLDAVQMSPNDNARRDSSSENKTRPDLPSRRRFPKLPRQVECLVVLCLVVLWLFFVVVLWISIDGSGMWAAQYVAHVFRRSLSTQSLSAPVSTSCFGFGFNPAN
jgi:hypothetical protein